MVADNSNRIKSQGLIKLITVRVMVSPKQRVSVSERNILYLTASHHRGC